MSTPLTRRHLLGGLGAAGLAAALGACGTDQQHQQHQKATGRATIGTATPGTARTAAAERSLATLETRFAGRLGLLAHDTATGAVVAHRADERFLLCSTFKALAVAAVLARAERQPGLLERVVTYDAAQVIDHSPVTGAHVGTGLSVGALCEAAMVPSDNTAANLLLGVLGGPPAVTDYCRTLGDRTTDLDRNEPTVNRVDPTHPGDIVGVEDTSTPAALAADLGRLVLGPALEPAGRAQLTGWMVACQTGTDLVRAGVPTTWRVGDKSGSGYRNEANDVAVVWPPGRPPLVITVFTTPDDPTSTAGPATVAAATSVAVGALV